MNNAPKFRYFDGYLDWIEPNENREIAIPSLPAGITGISGNAFFKCQDVESLVIPEGITNIRIAQTEYVKSLKRIVLPSTLKTIEKGVFEDLAALETVTLSEGTEVIEEEAFKNCTELKSINFPSTLKMIGKSAFECCASLESVALPRGIEKVDEKAFENCPRLTISFEEDISEEKKAVFSSLLPDQYTIYEVCAESNENKENVNKISLNGCSPFFHDEDIEIRTVGVSRERFLELFEQTRPYHVIFGFSNDKSNALCRGIRPNEVVYRDGKLYGIREIYHDEGEYCDRTWAVLREPSDTPFILEIGKDAHTNVSCFCRLTRKPDPKSEDTEDDSKH